MILLATAGGAQAAPAPATAALAVTPIGPDAAACASDAQGTAVVVTVEGLRDRNGTLRLQSYGDDPKAFLEKGKRLARIEVPVRPGPMAVCMALPKPGRYALYVLHDRNANGKADVFRDGFGFSRNPRLGLAKPEFDKVVFTAPEGVSALTVRVQYSGGNAALVSRP
jgi:uncharacterized protein (DUF2141 family)